VMRRQTEARRDVPDGSGVSFYGEVHQHSQGIVGSLS
jgi:hypothetical protein